MANSVFQDPFGVDWPLGYVNVSAAGTPVNIMHNVDPNNNNTPSASSTPGSPATASEYTPRCHKILFQGFKPGGANNNAMIPNTGYIYILRALGPNNQNSGGSQNRADTGAIVAMVAPGNIAPYGIVIPADEVDLGTISPYRYTIDSDNNNEGCVVTLIGCAR